MLRSSHLRLLALPFEPMALTTLDFLNGQLQRGAQLVHEEGIDTFRSGHFFISPKHDGVRVVSYVDPSAYDHFSSAPHGLVAPFGLPPGGNLTEYNQQLKTCFSRHGRPIWGMQWLEQELHLLRALSGDPYLVVDGELYLHKETDDVNSSKKKKKNTIIHNKTDEDKNSKSVLVSSKCSTTTTSVDFMTGFLAVASLVHRLRGKLQNPSVADVLKHVPSLPLYCLFDIASYSPSLIACTPNRKGKCAKHNRAVEKELHRIQQHCLAENAIADIRTLHIIPNVTPFSLRLRALGFLASLLKHAKESKILVNAFCPWYITESESLKELQKVRRIVREDSVTYLGGRYVKIIPYSLCQSLHDAQNYFLHTYVKEGFEGAVIRTPLNVYAMREKRAGTVAKIVSLGCEKKVSARASTRHRKNAYNRPSKNSSKREDHVDVLGMTIRQNLLSSAVKRAKRLPRRSPTAVKLLLYKDDEFPVLRPLFKEPSSNPRTRQLAEINTSSLDSSGKQSIKKSSSSSGAENPDKKKNNRVAFFGLQCLASNGRIFNVTLPKLSMDKQVELLRHLQEAPKGKRSLTGLYVTVKFSTLTEHGIPRFGTVKAIRGGKGWFL